MGSLHFTTRERNMPKKQNQKLKQKNRKFEKRETDMLKLFDNFSLPKHDQPTPKVVSVDISPAVMSSLKTIKKNPNKKKNTRNKKKREAVLEKALAKEGILEAKISKIGKKNDQKSQAKSAW